jgi:hypothetical protein
MSIGIVKIRTAAIAIAAGSMMALGVASFRATDASAYGAFAFCTGSRQSHASCEGPRHYPQVSTNKSTNGGWSWSWVWNERWGSNASSCQSGNCQSWAEVGGTAYGKEQMSNIAGGTYYFEPVWLGNW